MKRTLLILALVFGFMQADINIMGESVVDNDLRITTLISAGWVRYFIHLDDLSKAERVIICEAPFRDIEALGLDAWSALNEANVTYENGFKSFIIGNTKKVLDCVGIGD